MSASCVLREQVLQYLGRYTHRVAIANSRLVDFSADSVAFRWKDYRHDSKPKVMRLAAQPCLVGAGDTTCAGANDELVITWHLHRHLSRRLRSRTSARWRRFIQDNQIQMVDN